MLRRIIYSLLVMLIFEAFSAAIADAYVGQQQLNHMAALKFELADDGLNDVFRLVLSEYQRDQAFTRKLSSAEQAWITFREKELEALYPAPYIQRYGSWFPMWFYGEKTKLTSLRADQLKEWMFGMPYNQKIGSIDRTMLTGTQQEMSDILTGEFKQADDTLNQVYSQILITYKDDQLFIVKLSDAELAWIAFRDAEVDAVNAAENKRIRYNELAPLAGDIEKIRLTWARVEQLKEWTEGMPEGGGWGSRRVNPDKH